jgi:hypothetical protein
VQLLYTILFSTLFILSAAQTKEDLRLLFSSSWGQPQGLKIFIPFLEMMKRGWMLFLELLCAVQHVGVFAVRVKSEETAELRKNNIARPGDAAGRVRSTFFWPLKTGAVRAGGKGARLPIICASVCPPQRDLHSLCCVCPVRARLLGRCFLYPPVLKDFAAWQLPFFRKTPTDEKSAARLLIEKRFFYLGDAQKKVFLLVNRAQ